MFYDKERYRILLENSYNIGCRFVLCIIRPEIDFEKETSIFMKEMKSFLHKSYSADNWPCTKIFDDDAEIYIYELSTPSLKVILKHTESFASWEQPKMPEDFSILWTENEVFIASSTSEKKIWINKSHFIPSFITQIHDSDIEYIDIKWKVL